MYKSVPDAVIIDVGGHVIGRRLALVAARSHGHARRARFEHRDIDLGVTEGHGIGTVGAQVLEQRVDGVRLVMPRTPMSPKSAVSPAPPQV